MWFSLSAQTTYFLWSLVLGLALGALYDIVRAVRMLTGARGLSVILSDILFFAVCGVITSLFALPFNKGDVRGFILFGEFVGFFTYRLTLGNIMGRFYAFFTKLLRIIVQKIRKFLEKFFNLLLKAIAFMVYNISVEMDKLQKYAADRRQKHRAAVLQKRKTKRRLHKEQSNEQNKNNKTAQGGRYRGRKVRRRQKRR